MSLCPHCKAAFQNVKLTGIKASNLVKTWDAVSFDCPACDASLSVCIDPVVIKNLTVEEITGPLRSQSARQSSYGQPGNR